MSIGEVKPYQKQMEIDRIDREHLTLKHQELKIKQAIQDNERQRIKRLATPDTVRGLGTKVDTLA